MLKLRVDMGADALGNSHIMKLSYSSNAYMQFSIEETIRRIAALGYGGLELLADVPHAWPAGLLRERKSAIRRCLDEHGYDAADLGN